ncbi:MAG TPA: proline--tRNA ligase [Candidatus Coatesbacteria bacterium]|nr:proline--tRNA ligase [Candidatus Coatesbacteria bacterium]
MSKADEQKGSLEAITDINEDFSAWYTDVVRQAKLADYTSLKGCMVIRPYGYALWENMQANLDARIKATGHVNAYFPLFIPQSLLAKEAEHVEGFAPQVAWVTRGGDKELEEPLAVRPTSEAIICSLYSKWVQSWRDLPLLINQWANVVRWEKVTRLFLRTTEFLWQEGHTCHRTEAEALNEALKMLEVYERFYTEDLAVPVLKGLKSPSEKFAGARETFCVEALMKDGRSLQAGTTHDLGQHFAKVFDITFLDEDETEKHVWQTSWGVSTRSVGAVVMTHGDARGLRLPPKVAPVQAVIVPILFDKTREETLHYCSYVAEILSDLRVELDASDKSPGWKFAEHELRGVPLRLEVGPRDMEADQVTLVRRDTSEKRPVLVADLPRVAKETLDLVQEELYCQALAFREEHTFRADSLAELAGGLEERRGFYRAPWCGREACEEEVKQKTKATIRLLPFEQPEERGSCLVCGKKARWEALFARAY